MKEQEQKNFIWLPTIKEELLLKSGLFEDSAAISCWLNWKKIAQTKKDFREAETRLFPLVYHNLQKLNYSDEFTELLKKTHRKAFKNTNLQLQIVENLVKLFKDNNIRTILLKGTALGIVYYESIALRPMADIDLLIKTDDFPKAVEVLKTQDWHPQEQNLSLIIKIIQSCEFRSFGKTELDLHWRLMRDCWNADKTDIFWESAIPVKYNSLAAETLCPTDQLFHICCHGARYNPISPIRWIADAVMILRSPFEIDWQRLLELGKLSRQNLLLFHALSYLKETFNAPIPKDYLQHLKEIPKTRLEKMSFYHFSQPPKAWTIGRFLQEAAFQYSTQISSTQLKPRSLIFIKYLQHFLKIEKISKKLLSPKT